MIIKSVSKVNIAAQEVLFIGPASSLAKGLRSTPIPLLIVEKMSGSRTLASEDSREEVQIIDPWLK